ncbi:hypothetical protein FOVG_15698 [Fusarium oxysporum f. sp. pisi HDV247]|uniref:Uncharacterized protein n=1 Tax=Fusarium oxysporum f. sp. pisi HDV247 TaxID=1080344 RepID=W9NZC4_FUSOX|nr:hypothetical protein FOVG_15698 [Fusarium oxysporum f. sp. pisi HDV247]
MAHGLCRIPQTLLSDGQQKCIIAAGGNGINCPMNTNMPLVWQTILDGKDTESHEDGITSDIHRLRGCQWKTCSSGWKLWTSPKCTLYQSSMEALGRKERVYSLTFPPALTGLENLSIRGRWLNWRTYLAEWEAAPGPLPKNKWSSSPPPPARDFILALPPTLKKLTWTKSETVQEDIFDSVLKHHGASLENLEWTNHEGGFKPRPILTEDQLRSLGKWAPDLTSLTVDLERRNGTLPEDELTILAETLPKLRRLIVNLNLLDERLLMNNTGYDDKKKHASDSVLDVEEGLDLFQGLRKAKVGEKFDNVEFRQGEWTDDWPFGESLWEDRYWVRCWLVEKDGGPGARCKSGRENTFDADF